jgi:putative hydrolase of HD superfamily
MSKDLDNLIDFVKFTHQIRQVKRAIVLDDDAHENDMEHQYQMAVTALFIIDINNLKLDKYKCMALGLVHDTVEVYAGDISFFAANKDLNVKAQQEKDAVKKIKTNWPTNTTMHELIDEYESRKTPEAKFVYALDKLVPEINNYLYEGKAWKAQGITIDRVINAKKGKVDIDPTIAKYHQQIMKAFKEHPEYFGTNL